MPDVRISTPPWLRSAWTDLPASRFAVAPAWLAGLILAWLVALVVYGVTPNPTRGPSAAIVAAADGDDIALYDKIARRVAAGEPYHAAAVAAHRQAGYPLQPFVTVRLPTLAWVEAVAGRATMPLLWGLVLLALLAAAWRLRTDLGPGRLPVYAAVLAALGLAPTLAPMSAHWHEPWAAVLILFSLAMRSRGAWVASVVIGVTAVAFRELALPYLAVMAVAAVVEKRRREAAAWLAAALLFSALLGVHAHLLAAYVQPNDLRSPGWGGFGGWRFVLQMVQHFTGLAPLGPMLVAIATPLALLGWAGWPGSFGTRGALLVLGYTGLFMVFGQPYNVYWGMMLSPLLPLGLVFAPSALRDLLRSAAGVIAGRRVPAVSAG